MLLGPASRLELALMKTNLAPLRTLVGICLFFGLVGLGVMLWISTFAREGVGAGAYFVTPALPGTRFKPEILPLLGQLGGGALGLGLAVLVIERIATARARRLAAMPEADRPAPRVQTPAQIGLSVGLSLLIGGVGFLGYRWHAYVTNTDSPYDEVGIELNSRAPGFLNGWGCAQLKATFGERVVPPYGCSRPDGGWK